MTRNFRGSLLIASLLSSRGRRRRRLAAGDGPALRLHPVISCGGYTGGYYGSSQGYYGGGGYGTTGGGYFNQRSQGGYTQPGYYGGQPGTGYDFGRPGYNPGGIGGPASGIGVRPGLGAGGFGPGR